MPDDTDTNLQATKTTNSNLPPTPIATRQQALQNLRNSLRQGQQSMADWQGGELAVSAVPGAGKSTGMAIAAAIAIARYQLHSRRQLLVVTFTRSAAASIKAKISKYLKELSLPRNSFVVYTLHGLALNIANRHPDLSGINLENTTIVTPNRNHRLIRACVEQWIAANPRRYSILLEGLSFDGEETERLRRHSVLRTEVLPDLAYMVIHEAKSSGLLPEDVWKLAQETGDGYEIMAVAAGLYQQYQNTARSRDTIDYDDMILAALRVLSNNAARKLWQNQYFAVFEDEAQDSTPLQSQLLQTLAIDPNHPSTPPNLIRVGDPNQAINSTFTPADPIYFNRFCQQCDQNQRLTTIDQAGRSCQIIIDAANFLLNWVNSSGLTGTELAFRPQDIRPVNTQDINSVNDNDNESKTNPQPEGRGLEIYYPRDIYQTVELIGKRVVELFERNPKHKPAILVRENRQGQFIAEQLEFLKRQHGIEVYDVAHTERHSHVPVEILKLLKFIERPHSPNCLKAALEVLVKRKLIATQDLNAIATYPEQFLYPGPLDSPQAPTVRNAASSCRSLLRARLELPHYQLISFLALSLNYDKSELATVEKLAERVAKQTHGNSSMSTTVSTLAEIVSSERFEPVEAEKDDSHEENSRKLTIITMHKAKGLDWDYVFIPFLHEDILPSSPWVPTAAKFLGEFTLAEVARAQIRASLHEQPLPMAPEAWKQAGYLKTAEEFRLLYVAMTRAKRLLWISAAAQAPFRWNTFSGKGDNLQPKKPCPVLPELEGNFMK